MTSARRLWLIAGGFVVAALGLTVWLGGGWAGMDRSGARAPTAQTTDLPPTSANRPAAEIMPALLTQIYEAFALEDEAEIYDALSVAVVGETVTDLYLQRRRAQVADHAEDGQTQITSVEVYDVTPLATPGAFHVAWRVVGRVRHVAHIHERINLYAADLTLVPVDGLWKLTGFTLTDSSRETDYNFEGGE